MQKIIDYYIEKIGFMSSSVYAEINCYLTNGVEAELIILCIKKAYDAHKLSWNYIRAIIKASLDDKKQSSQTTASQKDYEIGDVPW